MLLEHELIARIAKAVVVHKYAQKADELLDELIKEANRLAEENCVRYEEVPKPLRGAFLSKTDILYDIEPARHLPLLCRQREKEGKVKIHSSGISVKVGTYLSDRTPSSSTSVIMTITPEASSASAELRVLNKDASDLYNRTYDQLMAFTTVERLLAKYPELRPILKKFGVRGLDEPEEVLQEFINTTNTKEV